VLSYTFIAYFIYRVYRLLAKISSWLAWNDHVQEHDMVEEAKQYLARTALEQSLLNEALVTRSGLVARKVSRKEIQEQKRMPVIQFSLFGDYIQEFASIADAGKAIGVSKGNIWHCCEGTRKSCGGYVWKYKDMENDSMSL